MNANKKRIKIETVNALSMSELEYIVKNIKKMKNRLTFLLHLHVELTILSS